MRRLKDIHFDDLLKAVQDLPEEQRQKLFWALRKQEAMKDNNRLDHLIFEKS